jgi:Sulfotransferase family
MCILIDKLLDAPMKNTPDFICIGMQKAGTTWLAANLGQHPSVWIPPIKEIHYFDETHVDPGWHIRRQGAAANNLKRFNTLGTAEPIVGKALNEMKFWQHMGQREISDQWYHAIWSFANADNKLLGEMTPDYSIIPLAGVEHVHRLAPHTKIVVLIRDPIDRTWSSTRMYAKEQGINPLECYKEQFIIERSRIQKMFNKWEQFFPKDNFFIAFYEDVALRPYWLLEEVCSFIGVDFDQNYFLNANKKVHVGSSSEMPDTVLKHYKELFFEDISFARERFKSYATSWYNTYY